MPKSKRPTAINQRVKSIVDIATGEVTKSKEDIDLIEADASAMGRKGGKTGGKIRAEKLSAERRSEIAKKGAAARWNKKK